MATHLAAAYSHPLSSPTMHHSAVLSSSYTLPIPTQLDAVVALSYDQLTRNPAYVRAILLSYCRSKLKRRRNGQLEGMREEVGKKLDKLERVLVKQGFTTFSLPLLQTRHTLSLPLPDPSLPSASVDASAPSAPFTFSYTIVPSSSSSSNAPSSSTRRPSSTLHSYPNGEPPTVRLRRSTTSTGAGSISSSSASPAIFGNMDGIDRDRAAVVREEENEENEEAGELLPRYIDREGGLPTYSTRVGEGEAPRYARAAAASPSPAVAAASVAEAEETRRGRERGRDQFWWGVEGGAGGVA